MPGYSTPRKADVPPQQQPHGTPPPFALQMSSPSPTKRGAPQPPVGGFGGLPGQPMMQQQPGKQRRQWVHGIHLQLH